MESRRQHWDGVYATKAEMEVSWYQASPVRSLSMIEAVASAKSVIDIGAGASLLVDAILDRGYDVTALDVSSAALARIKTRLGLRAARLATIVADVTEWEPARTWGVWHDRAAFHFLTESADQDAYLRALRAGTHPGSSVILACFAPDGPERCSGLPVRRYDVDGLTARLGASYRVIGSEREAHHTPKGAVQNFQYVAFRRET